MEPLSSEDGIELLKVARKAIEATLQKTSPDKAKALRKNRGVFTALRIEKKVRGCFGFPYSDPDKSLEESLQEAAIESALDPRFPPLGKEHLPHIEIELSFLTLPQPIELHQIQLGIHGLIITQEENRGLLLPQVALEYGLNLETLLEKLCLKAGLAPNAWKEGAQLSAFKAQVFRENSLSLR